MMHTKSNTKNKINRWKGGDFTDKDGAKANTKRRKNAYLFCKPFKLLMLRQW